MFFTKRTRLSSADTHRHHSTQCIPLLKAPKGTRVTLSPGTDCTIDESSLVIVVTETYKKVLVLLMRQLICFRRPIQAPSGVFPPNKSAGLSARSCVTSQVHEAFLRAIFAPAGHRINVFLRRRGVS